IRAAALSADGCWVVTDAKDGRAALWDTQSGGTLLTLREHSSPLHAAGFSPDGRQLLTASGDGDARLWDLASGEERIRFHRFHHLGEGRDWLVTTPQGLCDGPPDAWGTLAYQAGGATPPIRLKDSPDRFRRAGLLAKVLAGERLPIPKVEIGRS